MRNDGIAIRCCFYRRGVAGGGTRVGRQSVPVDFEWNFLLPQSTGGDNKPRRGACNLQVI